MPDGPVIHAKLMDIMCDQPRRQLREHFRKRGEDDAKSVDGLLYKAYQEGVRDGFAQGIAAADSPATDNKEA
jgi:hypothetical protein